MSQFSHPTIPLRTQFQAHRVAWGLALLAVLATATIALVVAIDGGSSSTTVDRPGTHVGVPRTDGIKQESVIAASVGSRPSTGSSESAVAAAVGGSGATRPTGGPDESSVAASLSKSSQSQQSGPNEAATAAAISGR